MRKKAAVSDPKFGAAKVWDGDLLTYALSKAVKAYFETRVFPSSASFTAYKRPS